MKWTDIVGQERLISVLKNAIEDNRIAHAQLFVGEEGYGVLPLAMAYAHEVFSRENEHSVSKVNTLNHLDLHFSFPVFKRDKSSLSSLFFQEWREMILENPYASLSDWEDILEAENKQLSIYEDEENEWGKMLNLKSFEGGTKFLIIWRADRIRVEAANKFLKLLEEPPKNTIIILLADRIDNMLDTILSRCQIIEVPRIADDAIVEKLRVEYELSEDRISEIIHQSQGNYNIAQKLAKQGDLDEEFEELFISWVRNAFVAKKNPKVLKDIVFWARTISEWSRDKQKGFLAYCSEIFRLALLQNYGTENALIYKKLTKDNFKWEAFSRYIHGANIEAILEEITEADLHIYRNANAKIVWTDLGIKLIRNIHKTY